MTADIFSQFGIDTSQEAPIAQIVQDDVKFTDKNVDIIWLSPALRWGVAFNDNGGYTEYFYLSDAELEAIQAHIRTRISRAYVGTYNATAQAAFHEYPNPYSEYIGYEFGTPAQRSQYRDYEGSDLQAAIKTANCTEYHF